MKQVLLLVLLFAFLGPTVVDAFAPLAARSRLVTTARGADGASGDAEKLRESAQKLRDEAQALESKMDRKPAAAGTVFEPPLAYTSLKESIWTLTYRFASDPNDENDNDEEVQPVSNYSGKLTVKLLSDGYTELISHEPTGSARLELLKVWGWDKEVGEEDEKDYVLFSTNIKVPDTDVAMPKEELRFYWQARVDTDKSNSGALSLTDGTVTVKKDVKPPGGGFWGVFNGGGILAQFRYVGNFAAKATAAVADQ